MPAKKKLRAAAAADGSMNFAALVAAIQQAHEHCAAQANRAVNLGLTLRNWVIGWYVREYEQSGADRAKYGEGLLDKVAERLGAAGHDELTARYLRLCRQFAAVYPGIWRSVTAKSGQTLLPDPIWRSLTAKSSATLDMATRESATPAWVIPIDKLLGTLSFTHLEQLIAIEDPLKRAFYEIESIRGNWSVRALKRQIATLYFERSGLSKDKAKLSAMAQQGVQTTEPKLAIRDPYIFEFLGLRAKDAMAETELEAALVENLREFLLELGHGFCLEAQQKSIVIGNTRAFVDLVFYHRILKCHVLVELKVDEFKQEHLGQLNTYVTWYRQHMTAEGDNPPVGLLLCTGKDHALVQYATTSVDNRLFVSKYAVQLPAKGDLERFLHARHLEMLGNASGANHSTTAQ